MSLVAQGLSYAYQPGRPVLRDVSLSLSRGEVVFILGANGSGKTTLLECLCGLRRPTAGRVLLAGRDLYLVPPRARAQVIGLVPQIHVPVFSYTVWEVVLMGRTPHLGAFSRPGQIDAEKTAAALQAVGLWHLRNRPYTSLSGGEQRLSLIARGLAQGARFLLLDEPDAHLDPRHQHNVLSLVQKLSSEGLAVAAASHSPNNALVYADQVVLITEGMITGQGRPQDALTADALSLAYGIPFELIGDGQGPRAVVPRPDQPEKSEANSSTERESGAGSLYSSSSRDRASAAANGA